VKSPSPPALSVVDSSGWLEYMTDGPNADAFAPLIESPELLVVPTISILEVFKHVLRERGEDSALQAAALMQQGQILDLDVALGIRAAQLGLQHRLPLADSVILATAEATRATLWTQDRDFEGIRGVEYRPKPQPA
jgi:toxin FitB